MKKSLAGVVVLAFLLLATACINRIRTGETQTRTETVAREDATDVEVDITMGAGRLTVDGGAAELLEAEFTYNVADWDPEVDYEVEGSTGRLRITQPEEPNIGIPTDEVEYVWELNLNEDVPLELDIELGAGEAVLDLDDLNISRLTMRTGAGTAEVYVNGTLTDLDVEAGVGELVLDLSGDWETSLSGSIRSGVGQLTVRVPAGVGVRITTETGIGNVEVTGLERDGDAYVNEAYGESEYTLELDIEGGVGQIILEVVEE